MSIRGYMILLYKNMMHGPCGALNENSPCMAKGRCTKQYPRLLVPNTITGNDGYQQNSRRSTEDGGKTAMIKKRNGTTIEVDNQWVVQYSPLLSKTFNAHINVEYCNSLKEIKYICKYVNKGSDMAVFGLQSEISDIDKIVQYQAGRYISSNETVWRILSFPIHERSPAVTHLTVHLQNGQRVYFSESSVQKRALNPPDTTLTAFFSLCKNDSFAKKNCCILKCLRITRGILKIKYLNVENKVSQSTANLPSSKIPR